MHNMWLATGKPVKSYSGDEHAEHTAIVTSTWQGARFDHDGIVAQCSILSQWSHKQSVKHSHLPYKYREDSNKSNMEPAARVDHAFSLRYL